jgi:hypothetical protein
VGFKDEKKAPKNRGFNRIGGAGGNVIRALSCCFITPLILACFAWVT